MFSYTLSAYYQSQSLLTKHYTIDTTMVVPHLDTGRWWRERMDFGTVQCLVLNT